MEAGNKAEGIGRVEIGKMGVHDPGAHLVIGNGNPVHGLDQEAI